MNTQPTTNTQARHTPEQWLIWSNEHRAWWKPDHRGYCNDITTAGRYSFDEAHAICTDANSHLDDIAVPFETMLLAPECRGNRALAGLNPEAVGAVVEALELAEKQMTLIAISHKIDVEKEIRDYPTCPLAIVRAALKAVRQ